MVSILNDEYWTIIQNQVFSETSTVVMSFRRLEKAPNNVLKSWRTELRWQKLKTTNRKKIRSYIAPLLFCTTVWYLSLLQKAQQLLSSDVQKIKRIIRFHTFVCDWVIVKRRERQYNFGREHLRQHEFPPIL